MLRTILFLQKVRKGNNSVITQGFCILQFPSWPSISVSSFIKLPSILLETCFGQKCDGRTNEQTVGRTKPPFGEQKKLKKNSSCQLLAKVCAGSTG